MKRPHFTDDFKIDAIKQITERVNSTSIVAILNKMTGADGLYSNKLHSGGCG